MSTNRRIYLDYNATSPLHPAARAALSDALDAIGNPSSIHDEGRRMRARISRARTQVAALLGRPVEQVLFTSGGTEANVLGVAALARVAERHGKLRVIATTAIEHPSLRGAISALAGWRVTSLDDPDASVAAFAAVNHELGTVEPRAFTSELRDRHVLVHVDAVQAAGKLDLATISADSVAVSGHKIGAPQGIGALALTDDSGLPLVEAGHQERGRRPGTENTLGIVAFGAAAAAVDLGRWPAVAELGAALEHGLVALGARIHGADRARTGGTINAAFAGALGESIVIALDLAGIAASTGAACTSGSLEPSPVLL
ncbi:MAG TPA: aminotransferase class V-fold PLP-dependent enzyme, partial [Kofleriaceae bacterium]|nr:aminotransferase class V-fold PLP-dependent enzyme [Kofleriaceae bacterium]